MFPLTTGQSHSYEHGSYQDARGDHDQNHNYGRIGVVCGVSDDILELFQNALHGINYHPLAERVPLWLQPASFSAEKHSSMQYSSARVMHTRYTSALEVLV